MSEADAPERSPGVELRASAQPAVLNAKPAGMFQGGGFAVRQPEDHLVTRFSIRSASPLPYLAVALVLMAAAWSTVQWARVPSGGVAEDGSSEWWTNVLAVLAPAEALGTGAVEDSRMWVALAVATAAAIATAVCIGRIGANVRPGAGPFGSWLPILAFPAWWVLPVTVGRSADGSLGRYDSLIRYLVALGMLITQYLIVRWPTTNRLWRAGNLRFDAAALVLWLPAMIPWLFIIGSNLTTVFLLSADEAMTESPWYPTAAMADWATWVGRATAAGLLVLLVVVSVAQHIGISQDRLDIEATRSR